MTDRTISGIMHITLAVPFTVTDWVEDGEEADGEAWLRAVNDGSLPDAMEGAQMEVANSDDHEVVGWEIQSADYEPEPTDSMTADTDPALDAYREEVALVREHAAALGLVTVATVPGSMVGEIVRRMEAMDDPEPNDSEIGANRG